MISASALNRPISMDISWPTSDRSADGADQSKFGSPRPSGDSADGRNFEKRHRQHNSNFSPAASQFHLTGHGWPKVREIIARLACR